MKIIVDENIIYAEEAFSALGKVHLYPGRAITSDIVKDADALITRSITDVNESLLKGSSVKFVGTATIGTDHIDLDYLAANNITFADAKGCNSDAVAEYVFNTLFRIANEQGFKLKDKSIGIVGVGNIGSRIERIASAMGMKIFKNDPPLERAGVSGFLPLSDVLEADIITFHIPLNKGGIDNTVHLLGVDELSKLKENTILINASRGAVVDNTALLSALEGKSLTVVLDVWEEEPDINTELLCKIKYGTPHTAGYSLEGKINGTTMMYNSLCSYLSKTPVWKPDMPIPENSIVKMDTSAEAESEIFRLFDLVYDIREDDKRLREIFKAGNKSAYFDKLRKDYPLRRELSNYTAIVDGTNTQLTSILKALRVRIM